MGFTLFYDGLMSEEAPLSAARSRVIDGSGTRQIIERSFDSRSCRDPNVSCPPWRFSSSAVGRCFSSFRKLKWA